MKIIYNKFDKKTISTLPQVVFPGRIISIISPGETEKAVDYLLSSDILGVDTETKPTFHRGEHHEVALLQVANRDTAFLFRLCLTGITPAIKRFLEDETVKRSVSRGTMIFTSSRHVSTSSPATSSIFRTWWGR